MDLAALEAMLARGEDNALLRFTLGSALYRQRKWAQAEAHLAKAVELDPAHSAGWKMYGRTLSALGKTAAAAAAFEQGIDVASAQGDMQALREMKVFLGRLEKTP